MTRSPTPISVTLYGHLTVKTFEDNRTAVTYLGYPLHLSPDEFRLLHTLLTQPPDQADSQGYFPVQTILESMRSSVAEEHPMTDEERLAIFFSGNKTVHHEFSPREPYSVEQIAILASRINKKSAAIGGRKLIPGKSHHGYRINPYM